MFLKMSSISFFKELSSLGVYILIKPLEPLQVGPLHKSKSEKYRWLTPRPLKHVRKDSTDFKMLAADFPGGPHPGGKGPAAVGGARAAGAG